jgi:D-beta-D-heptose 7-phosphate kinase/D-beta-D-heptose 1-phosphate adenosyltransferase
MIGSDNYGETIRTILDKYPRITTELCSNETYTTTVKTRGFSNKKIIFRYDIEKKKDLLENHRNSIESKLKSIIKEQQIDSIVLSDYNKGFITKNLAQSVIRIARENGIPTFVDPKIDYNKFIGCTVFKPNIKEIKDIFNIDYSFKKLKEIHLTIKERVQCKETLLTLSEQGITYLTDSGDFIHESTIPTEVNDVTGAGDVVLAVMAYFYGNISNMELIRLATWAGTHSVKHTGTYILKRSDILESYKAINGNKYISVDSLKYLKNPIVFTNGCFDIVHEGHIALFKYCKSIKQAGGYVVVALNSDESIKGLKGSSRPVNNLQARIAILNEFESIDWIISFNDETPYNILKEIRPSVIVKGGDYTPDSVIGRELCDEVQIFKYMEGKSTTNIIKRIISDLA